LYFFAASNFLTEKTSGLPYLDFEWMLTDTCGATNQGQTDGPKFNLVSLTFQASQSVYAGKAARFAGSSSSYAVTDQDSALNNTYGTNSFTMMYWVYWASTATGPCGSAFCSPLVEYSQGSSYRGFLTFIVEGGLWYDILYYTTGCTGNCKLVTYTINPIVGTWYHIAVKYDGKNGVISSFLNYTLVATNTVGQPTTTKMW
jgi:hypothetical protein